MDENIGPALARGLLRVEPNLEVVLGYLRFPGMSDPELIEWATENNYILITRDVNTLIGYAYQRIERGISTAGVFILRKEAPLSEIIEHLLLIASASQTDEWENQITYIPLQ